jgi:SNF2 family DNA or RNA helicase
MPSMRVNTKVPFELVYSFYEHPQLGYLLEYMAVQLIPNGQYSLLSQKLHHNTAADFGAEKKAIDLLKSLDETEPEFLIKRFYTGKKPLRPSDFFAKHYTPELHAKIRPFIEKRILKVLEKIEGEKLFLARDKNFTHTPVEIAQEKAGILFHFRRNENGTNYFATIKLGDKKISFSQNNSELIIQEPAYLLCDGQLITFKKETDGNKIKPFLQKKFINIPSKSEAVYFEKFVKPLIENYDVYAEGFEIRSERFRAFPILKISHFLEDGLCVGLYFNYGPYQFPYHSTKMVSVSLEKNADNYIFHRVKRSKNWENTVVEELYKLPLKIFEGSLFIAENQNDNIIELINRNKNKLLDFGFQIDQSQLKKSYLIGESNLSFNIKQEGDWFDLEAHVKFGEFTFPFMKLKNYILNGVREFELPNGSIAIIPEEWFNRYSNLFDFSNANSEHLQIKKYHFGLLEGIFSDSKNETFKNIEPFNPEFQNQLPHGLKATLRPYQIIGYNWLIYMKNNGFGACLADDMGLGKTLQILSFLQFQKEQSSGIIQSAGATANQNTDLFGNPLAEQVPSSESNYCTLVIVPTSLIYNWQSEAIKFTNLKIYVHTGFNRSKFIKSKVNKYDLIISSYGTVRNDIDIFSQIEFDSIVLDESQAIKNPGSQTSVSVNKLKAKHKIVMTGTPVENSIMDLWSQINFVNPGILGNYHFFNKKYVTAIEKDKSEEDTLKLKQIVNPFILRRTKEQVAEDLPKKTEKIIYCEMSDEQKQQYETVKSGFRNELLNSINEQGFKKSNMMILNGLIKLRQIANHPVLSDKKYEFGSGKFDQIVESLHNAIESGHKVLIFSQFVQHLNLLKTYLDEKEIEYLYIAGSVSSFERKQLVDKFQKDKASQLFLISLKAGGTGLNLTAADYVFLLDPWWNPAVERQAMDRSHRIGQKKPVFVYKFITKDTIEEKIVSLQAKKQRVSDDILDTEEQFVHNLEEDTLKNLLE